MSPRSMLPDDPVELRHLHQDTLTRIASLEEELTPLFERQRLFQAHVPQLAAKLDVLDAALEGGELPGGCRWTHRVADPRDSARYGEICYGSSFSGDPATGQGVVDDLLVRKDYFSQAELEALETIRGLRSRIQNKEQELAALRDRLGAIRVRALRNGITLIDGESRNMRVSRPGRPADSKILRRRELVKQYIHRKSDWRDRGKLEDLFERFDEEMLPPMEYREGGLQFDCDWVEFLGDQEEYIQNVINTLNRDRWR